MNKSIEFIKNQIEEDKVSENFPKKDWIEENINITIMNFFDMLEFILSKRDYDTIINKGKLKILVSNSEKEHIREIQAKIDSNAEYQYFLSKETVISITEDEAENETQMKNGLFKLTQLLFQEIISGRTYFVDKHPKDYETNYTKYNLKYTLGDLLIKLEDETDYTIKDNTKQNTQENIQNTEEQTIKGRLLTLVLPMSIKYSKQKNEMEERTNE